jgi:GNAT superfamily N-acetyltransferase
MSVSGARSAPEQRSGGSDPQPEESVGPGTPAAVRIDAAPSAPMGRADVWLATVHDEPVATFAVLRDGRGLALLADLVVQPAQRGRGHGTALLDAVTAAEHASAPGTRVFAEIDPGGAAEHMWRRDGAVVIAEVVERRRTRRTASSR